MEFIAKFIALLIVAAIVFVASIVAIEIFQPGMGDFGYRSQDIRPWGQR